MNRTHTWRLLAVLSVVAFAAMACGGDDDEASTTTAADDSSSGSTQAFINPDEDCTDYKPTQGISGNTIKIGTVRPTTGPYAIYDTVTKGLEAYFKSVNAKGGVKAGDGKTYQLELVKGDDGYNPANTPNAVKTLVEQEGIFAMVGEIGTETNLAVRQYMNDNCVPSISLATGSPEWNEAAKYPWYISALPSYATEANAALDYISAVKPDATIALLYQADDFGKAYKAAIEKYIEDNDSDLKVVDAKEFDPTANPNPEGVVTQLAASKADVFYVGIGGTPCPTALKTKPADWKPLTYVSVTCSGKLALSLAGGADEGVYTSQATLDPGDPADQSNPKVQAFMTDGAAQGLTKSELEGGIVSAGWGFGQTFVQGLMQAKEITRAGVMNQMFDFQDQSYGLLRDGTTVSTDGGDDPWLLETLRVAQRQGGSWKEVAPLKSYEGESNSLSG